LIRNTTRKCISWRLSCKWPKYSFVECISTSLEQNGGFTSISGSAEWKPTCTASWQRRESYWPLVRLAFPIPTFIIFDFPCSYIPEGTAARIHFWSVHRDARNFSHPDTFWPERWLIAEGLQDYHEKINHNPNAWIPFSFGPCNCVGKNLAMLELRMLLCHLVQRLSIKLPKGCDPAQYERELDDRFVFTIGRLPVIVESRCGDKSI
jgi:hypothetical protein